MSCMQKNLLCQEIHKGISHGRQTFSSFDRSIYSVFVGIRLTVWLFSKKLKQYFMFLRFLSRIPSDYCNYYNLQNQPFPNPALFIIQIPKILNGIKFLLPYFIDFKTNSFPFLNLGRIFKFAHLIQNCMWFNQQHYF